MMRASGQLDDPSPVKPEMQDKGRPASFIAGAAGEGVATGATRNLAETSNAEGMRCSGQLERTIAGTAEGSKPRGNLRIRTPAQQKGSGEGATWRRNPCGAGRMRKRGDPQLHRQAERDDALIHRAKDHPGSKEEGMGTRMPR